MTTDVDRSEPSDRFSSGPPSGEEQALQATPPPAWQWFRIYCLAMSLLYLLIFALGIAMVVSSGSFTHARGDKASVMVMGGFNALLGLVCLLIFAAAPFLPRKKWAWIYDLVLICLGMTSLCCMPVTIPLLIFWLNPDVKTWFGMKG